MLSRNDFASEMKELEVFFLKQLTPEQRDIWYGKVRHLSSPAFRAAVNACIMDGKFFPTIAAVLEKAAVSREIAEQREKAMSPTITQIARVKPKDDEYTREAKEVFRMVCLEGLTGEALKAVWDAMAEKYPGRWTV
jgi:hypothetical protein